MIELNLFRGPLITQRLWFWLPILRGLFRIGTLYVILVCIAKAIMAPYIFVLYVSHDATWPIFKNGIKLNNFFDKLIQFHCKIIFLFFLTGNFSFGSFTRFKSNTIVDFVQNAVEHSRSGRYLFFLNRRPTNGPMRVQLLHPVSRVKQVQSLQHMCRYLHFWKGLIYFIIIFMCKLFWNLIGFFDPHIISHNCKLKKKNILERKEVQFFCCSFGKVTFMHPCDVFFWEFCCYWISYYFWVRK